MTEINYAKIDSRIANLVRDMEAKPHIRYIRYLLSKRYSPAYIKQELRQAGLSAPHEEALTKYYLAVMDPLVKQLKLTPIYAEYKKKLTIKNSRRAPGAFTRELLNYKLEFSKEVDLQAAFHKFIRYFEIDDMWKKEILKYHGKIDNLPVGEDGNRILRGDWKDLNYEKVLSCPKRHTIDQLLLEHISDIRIVDHLQKQCNIKNISPADIHGYRKIFFNIQVVSTEQTIMALEYERDSLKQFVNDLDDKISGDDMSLSERIFTREKSMERINELDDSIRSFQAMHTDAVADAAYNDSIAIHSMFMDVMKRAHSRFIKLDSDSSRDAVDPLLKIATMMIKTHDKVDSIEKSDSWQKSSDMSSQEWMLQLYKESVEATAIKAIADANERLKDLGDEDGLRSDIDPNEICGIDELGINYVEGEDENDEGEL